MCAGTREDGSTIEANDPQWDSLNAAAQAARERPQAWLEQSGIYGDLSNNVRFAAAFGKALNGIWKNGSEAALADYTKS